jgi:hypothetical protein
VLERLAAAPGFIRRISVVDGESAYPIAFWRSIEEAQHVARLAKHRDAVRALRTRGIQYSHFVGLWAAHAVHDRQFFCPCGTVTAAPPHVCAGCGRLLMDPFAAGASGADGCD